MTLELNLDGARMSLAVSVGAAFTLRGSMTDVDMVAKLERFVAERASSTPLPSRRESIVSYFDSGFGTLPRVLSTLLNWAREHGPQLDGFILWGSFVTGEERDESFSFPHTHPDALALGPSDVDGLIVTDAALLRPTLNVTYCLFDSELKRRGVIEQDVYRDIIVLAKEDVGAWLASAAVRHRACVVEAYSSSGVVLKTCAELDSVLLQSLSVDECKAIGREAMLLRRERLQNIARRARQRRLEDAGSASSGLLD